MFPSKNWNLRSSQGSSLKRLGYFQSVAGADNDRIALAQKREEVLRPLAKEKRKETEGRPSNEEKLSAKLRPEKFKTSKESAKTAGVGDEGSVHGSGSDHHDGHGPKDQRYMPT